MGDRGNIVMLQRPSAEETGLVYLYSHWSGFTLPQKLQTALAKRWRWGDDSYLTRIIFDEMTKGNRDQETGFGISCYLGDNEYPLLVVDSDNRRVWTATEATPLEPVDSWSFEEYVALKFGKDAWSALRAVNGDESPPDEELEERFTTQGEEEA